MLPELEDEPPDTDDSSPWEVDPPEDPPSWKLLLDEAGELDNSPPS